MARTPIRRVTSGLHVFHAAAFVIKCHMPPLQFLTQFIVVHLLFHSFCFAVQRSPFSSIQSCAYLPLQTDAYFYSRENVFYTTAKLQ